MGETHFNFKYIFFLATIAALGGLLFGYDWVVIGGAKPFYELYFDIHDVPALQGWAMSSALVGCILGALSSGILADSVGRKYPLLIAAAFFTLSAFGTGYTDSFNLFILYRLLGGIGIGLASTISPMYIAEIAPEKYRGRLVSINQLTIVLGILGAQIANYLIADVVPEGSSSQQILVSWNGQWGWRWMFWAELFPAVFFFLLLFFIPDSPRYLIKIDKKDEAKKILTKLGGKTYAARQTKSVQQTYTVSGSSRIGFLELIDKKNFPILIIGVVLAVFQQWSGINIIFNYADEIFTSAGYGVSDMLFNIIVTGSVNLVFTLIAMRTVDGWGRRNLMTLGAAGLAAVYLILGGTYYFKITGWPIMILIVVAIAIYALTLAPITWVILSEIFPNRIRGVAMSIATFSLWASSFVLTFTFPILNGAFGVYGIFWIYSFICLLAYWFIKRNLPETKGRSLEKIEMDLTNDKT